MIQNHLSTLKHVWSSKAVSAGKSLELYFAVKSVVELKFIIIVL